jgi:Zn-dependent M16 (insulinase) family peptidase
MDHLDAAKLEEFKDFNKKFYVPNNAVLVVGETLTQLKLKNGSKILWCDKKRSLLKEKHS